MYSYISIEVEEEASEHHHEIGEVKRKLEM